MCRYLRREAIKYFHSVDSDPVKVYIMNKTPAIIWRNKKNDNQVTVFERKNEAVMVKETEAER